MADAPHELTLEVVTPLRAVVHESVSEIQLPGTGGYLGILPGHTPLLTELGIGALSYKKGGQTFYVTVIGGFAEVLAGRVTVLADASERPEDIDIARAQKSLAEAEKQLTSTSADPSTDWTHVLHAIERARVRLDVASHARSVAASSER